MSAEQRKALAELANEAQAWGMYDGGPDGYETWQAIHQDCPPENTCCTVIELDLDDDLLGRIRAAAEHLNISLDAFVHLSVVQAMRRDRA